jgi:hypothetical protein
MTIEGALIETEGFSKFAKRVPRLDCKLRLARYHRRMMPKIELLWHAIGKRIHFAYLRNMSEAN